MPDPVETPAAALMRLMNGYRVSQAIHVAAELRLADFIGDEPVTADEIAPRVGTHARSMYRLLRALSTVWPLSVRVVRTERRVPLMVMLRSRRPSNLE